MHERITTSGPDATGAFPPPAPPRPSIALLVAMTSVGPFAINAFVPSIPGLVGYFGTDLATAQLALTLYLIGVAGGQLVWGPLSDRFGRRPMLLAAFALCLIASAVCVAASSIEMLIAGRMFQAVGACAGIVLGRAMIRDMHGRDKAASMIGYVTMAMAVVPMVAPAIGGYLDVWFGWRATFVAMLVFCAVVLAFAVAFAHETHHDPMPLPGLTGMLKEYRTLIADRAFLGYTLNVSFTTAGFFAFLAGAPYLMVEVLQRPPSEYGLYFVSISATYMIGSFLTGRLSQRFGTRRMVAFGSWLTMPPMALVIVAAFAWELSPIQIFAPMCAASVGIGICQPNATAGAISVNPRLAGAASGMAGFVQMITGAAVAQLMGHLQDDTLAPLAAVMAGCFVLALAATPLIRPQRPA